jgi:hypothetical protein
LTGLLGLMPGQELIERLAVGALRQRAGDGIEDEAFTGCNLGALWHYREFIHLFS